MAQPELDRITLDPRRMGGKPCIRDSRVTAGREGASIQWGLPTPNQRTVSLPAARGIVSPQDRTERSDGRC